MKKMTPVMMNLHRTSGQRRLETYGSKSSTSPEREVQLIHVYSRTYHALLVLRLLQRLFHLVGHVEDRELSDSELRPDGSQKLAEEIYEEFADSLMARRI
jgi:hypothetical protein